MFLTQQELATIEQYEVVTEKKVSAKWIRKMATKYNIEITHQLRSNAVKSIYYTQICEAVIAEYLEEEAAIARLAAKQEIEDFVNEVEANLGSHYTYINLDSFARSLDIYYPAEKMIVGSVQKRNNGIGYRHYWESRSVVRMSDTIEDAIDLIIFYHADKMKASIT